MPQKVWARVLAKMYDKEILISSSILWASLVAQLVKNLPGMRETWVRSLGLEDSLEEDMAIHSCILA